MKKLLLAIISVLVLSGCATSSQSGAEYSTDDIAFAEMMIPHHDQAIEMSEIALMNSTNPDVLKLAQEIKDAQAPEIELMKSWPGVKVSIHAGHMMDGMLSKDELNGLREAKNADFDALFLKGMIKHHEGAIEMAQAVTTSANKDVADLSASIINAQQLEISKMEEMLNAG